MCVLQMKIEKMAQESRVQLAMEEQERRFGRITRSISGECTSELRAAHVIAISTLFRRALACWHLHNPTLHSSTQV